MHHQLENSGATFLITDGPLLNDVHLAGLPSLRRVYTTILPTPARRTSPAFFKPLRLIFRPLRLRPNKLWPRFPYSSGTTGLPKGVMLSHSNLVSNIYQLLGPNAAPLSHDEIMLCFLPLYHIYGLNVALNPIFALGATLVLMPRFNVPNLCMLLVQESVTMLPLVPPVMNALCQAAEANVFPAKHNVRWVKVPAPLRSLLNCRVASLN